MKALKFIPEIILDRTSAIPLRLQIVQQFRKAIILNRLPAGTKLISERQLAGKLKTNRNTVHQAYEQLTNDGLFQPSNLRSSSMMISSSASEKYRSPFPSLNLILPYCFSEQLKLANLCGLEIIAGVMDQAAELQISVNITALPAMTLPKPDISAWLESFIPRSIGVITLGLRCGEFDPVFEELLQCKTLPHVFVSGISPLPHISSVLPNIETGVHEMLDCLKKLGHRRLGIAAINYPKSGQFFNCAYERGRTITRIAHEYKMETVCAEIEINTSNHLINAYEIANQLLNGNPRPTAIWVQNDSLAEQFKHELIARGMRIPEDISLIGYDNTHSNDELSSINHSRFDIGAQAVNIINELFDHGSPGCALFRSIPSHFILKKSITHACM